MDLLQENEHLQEELQKLAAKVRIHPTSQNKVKLQNFLLLSLLKGHLRTFACYSTNHTEYFAGGPLCKSNLFSELSLQGQCHKISIFWKACQIKSEHPL
jgi:hypothetical protein